jgi:hypothetical protein
VLRDGLRDETASCIVKIVANFLLQKKTGCAVSEARGQIKERLFFGGSFFWKKQLFIFPSPFFFFIFVFLFVFRFSFCT